MVEVNVVVGGGGGEEICVLLYGAGLEVAGASFKLGVAARARCCLRYRHKGGDGCMCHYRRSGSCVHQVRRHAVQKTQSLLRRANKVLHVLVRRPLAPSFHVTKLERTRARRVLVVRMRM